MRILKTLKVSLVIGTIITLIILGVSINVGELNNKSTSSMKFTKSSEGAIYYTYGSAAINVIWKDSNITNRPENIRLELYNKTTENRAATIILSQNDFSISATSIEKIGRLETPSLELQSNERTANNKPKAYMVSDWAIKITGLIAANEYTLKLSENQDDTKIQNYTYIQSGTSLIMTSNNYSAYNSNTEKYDGNAWLETRNAKLFDKAGNLIVLKGVVTANTNTKQIPHFTDEETLNKLQNIGVNCLRITIPVTHSENNVEMNKLYNAIDNASKKRNIYNYRLRNNG